MLEGKPQSFCNDCHTLEELGAQSYRQIVNADYKSELNRLEQTDPSGFLTNNDIIYLDIRFSNICNLKCRSCNPDSSNSWYEDYKHVHPDSPAGKKTYQVTVDSKTIFSDIEKRLPSIQKIYFAGGEPLLDENHYLLLEKLIELGRTDVLLSYNTNLSRLSFSKWNVLQLWQKFQFVRIGASLDSIGPSLELIRKGSNWREIQANISQIQELTPHVVLQIYPTVSVMNCFKMTELIDYFLKQDFFKTTQQFEINLLNDPDYLNICILNTDEIDQLEKKYDGYISSVRTRAEPGIINHLEAELKRVIKFARHQSLNHLRKAFKKYTFTLDQLRSERTVEVVPELLSVLYE